MDWTLIFLTLLFGILIYMNYRKIKRFKKDNRTKKVSWSLSDATNKLTYQNPSIDFFDDSSNLMNSNIVKYLNNQSESYASKLYLVNPIKAWIPEDPSNLDDPNSWSAHEIVSQNDPNTRVQEYLEDPTQGVGSTIGELYDNMVDNYRVQWGKFEGLGAYDPTSYYGIDVEPSINGYTSFATY